MRAYHFLTAHNAFDDLEKRRIKISRIEDLNDPFELLPIELSDREVRRAFLQMKKFIDTQYGVICFSKGWSNPVLWSHYADKHRGVCLGFDISDEWVHQVSYNAKRLEHDIREVLRKGTRDAKLSFMKRLLGMKYKDWEYEDEVRVFTDLKEQESGLYFKEFDDKLVLREVVLGVRYAHNTAEIENILQGYKEVVTLIQGRLAFKSFKVVENKLKTKKLPNHKMQQAL